MSRPDLYFSCDVEADGPIPGPYSMVSIGLACVATFDGERFLRLAPRERTFYAELRPISERWDREALAVSGLTREHLETNGRDPGEAMHALDAWVRETATGHRPVFVAYPLGFDWLWYCHYAIAFGPGSAFGHSSALDVKTMYATKARAQLSRSTKRWMPEALFGDEEHTHNALDDAVEQGELFCNLFEWDGRG